MLKTSPVCQHWNTVSFHSNPQDRINVVINHLHCRDLWGTLGPCAGRKNTMENYRSDAKVQMKWQHSPNNISNTAATRREQGQDIQLFDGTVLQNDEIKNMAYSSVWTDEESRKCWFKKEMSWLTHSHSNTYCELHLKRCYKWTEWMIHTHMQHAKRHTHTSEEETGSEH